MELTAEQIQQNWNVVGKIVRKYISSPRQEKVLEMLEQLADFIILAPASGRTNYHNAFPGGYNDHVINVVKMALKTKDLWEEMGAVIDFTEEELVFSALFHDLGKIGDGEKDGYIQQTDKWRRDKLREAYQPNSELQFMLIQDRSLYVLQKYGIPLTFNEYMGIRLHDGIYDDANKAYYFSRTEEAKMKGNLVYILHHADFLAARVEYQRWLASQENTPKKVTKNSKTGKKQEISSSDGLMNLVKNI